ncbi:MAG: hypothetical protein II330_05890 [Clostridia bacterium]|nr:hypothetical protein [Clostridia bacterium]
MENITSKNNEKIKAAVAVRDSASQRRKNKKFFVEGARLCESVTGRRIALVTATCDRGENVTGRPKNVAGCHRQIKHTCDTHKPLRILGLSLFVTGVTGTFILII